jgi:PIN domain nuclease of toxin-antitoxin system
VRILLDTHIAIWAVSQSDRLSPRGRALLENASHTVHVSAVSIWEIAVKWSLGKSRTAVPFSGREALDLFTEAGFLFLDITSQHAAFVETLPSLHGDPFDRLLVSQALAEPMRLVTADATVARYSDAIINLA